jgi:hypothetical protein
VRRFHHGTNIVIGAIDLNMSRSRTDFGKGFYMGNKLGEARRWATSQSMATEIPTVMRYVLSNKIFNLNDSCLNRLWFTTPTVEWLDFVRDNRRIITPNAQSTEPRHDYDIVYDPIANDKVVDVVDEYIDGLITVEEAIRRVKVVQSVFQMSFHTPLALSYIDQSSTEYQQRAKDGKWSAWEKVN